MILMKMSEYVKIGRKISKYVIDHCTVKKRVKS